ncbi:MAG: YjbH domain-containing protein [Pseudomonadota bacterium]
MASADGFAGQLGAIDTPSATPWAVDDVVMGLDLREEVRVLSFGFQATERLQLDFRFPTYDNGGPSRGSEFNLAFRLLNEGAYTPSLGFGLTGLGGDDRGAGEYIIAGKRIGSVDIAAGVGWGRYAGLTSGRRDPGAAEESLATGHLFSEDSAAFANMRWDTPVEGLALLAEYAETPLGAEDEVIAAGFSYQLAKGLTMTAFGTSDEQAGLRFSFVANPGDGYIPLHLDRGPFPYVRRSEASVPAASAASVLAILEERLGDEDIAVVRFAMSETAVDVMVRPPANTTLAQAAGRTARVLSAIAPTDVETFRISRPGTPFDSQVVVLDRAGLEAAHGGADAGTRAWEAASIASAPLAWPDSLKNPTFTPGFSYGFATSLKADFLTSDSLEPTGTLSLNGSYVFAKGTTVSGSLGYRFLNQWEQADPPAEPGIRSDLTSYTPDEIYLNALSLRHKFRLSPEVYSRVSVGYFERQYGGVSAEVLWRAPELDFALGFEATYVQKRAYEDWFGFEDADATTVIGSVYANIGERGDFVELDVGQYLAGDTGVGLTVGRNFPNGWRVSANTAWSADSDDTIKFGAQLRVPLGWTIPDASDRAVTIGIGGPSGDFASRVSGTGTLYDDIRSSDRQVIKGGWGQFWN